MVNQLKKTDNLWFCKPSVKDRRFGIFEEVFVSLNDDDFVILCITDNFGDTSYKQLPVKEIKEISSFKDNPNYKGVQKRRWVEVEHWNNYHVTKDYF